MLLIPCPYCGPRAEAEFAYGGEAHVTRPESSAQVDDRAWGDYLFMRRNPKGPHAEQWRHAHGCGRWFNVVRDTVRYEILAVYEVGAQPPVVLAAAVRP